MSADTKADIPIRMAVTWLRDCKRDHVIVGGDLVLMRRSTFDSMTLAIKHDRYLNRCTDEISQATR